MSALYHLTKMDCCPARFPDCYSHSPTFLDLFLSFNLVFFLQLLSAHWEIWIVIVSVSIDFPSNPKVDALFYCTAYDYSRADWDDLCDHLRNFHRRLSLNLVLLQLLLNFVNGSRL